MVDHENTEDGGTEKPPWATLSAGLITGAADDDPSGIATYSQVGAAFGYGMLWCILVTMPLMIAIQAISAGIGRVTGHGLMEGIRRQYPRTLVYGLVTCIIVANVINLAADIGAMGAALKLLIGGPALLYAAGFALLSLVLQIFIPFTRYSPILKLLTMSLFAYVATVFVAAMYLYFPRRRGLCLFLLAVLAVWLVAFDFHFVSDVIVVAYLGLVVHSLAWRGKAWIERGY